MHEYIDSVQFSINAKISSLTQTSPSALMFARPLLFSTNLRHFQDSELEETLSDTQILERNEMMLKVLYSSVQAKVQAKLTARDAKANGTKKESVFLVGCSVMRLDPLRHQHSGIASWVGPYKVVRVTAARTLELLDSTGVLLQHSVPLNQCNKIADPASFFLVIKMYRALLWRRF